MGEILITHLALVSALRTGMCSVLTRKGRAKAGTEEMEETSEKKMSELRCGVKKNP
jgi:hypothetical protein